ncbi:LysR substrate-binding domain-containing protein [Streptomyces scopuliridis]|uniref:LysR substrate-binding domain-containing protein n=1 Tax=Streptomyces scopuliridis TaxID=452529 RepID=A0ACD4ZWI2_9ACTN|nr:LysR substrate-binding domain-containing protein [Streptomyces scopuliridis]WSC02846.1 LysR substrate-binding domain-containing protein [Streptomyces scopuliridis]WSC03619.1 LysR substrate-binding domain-containing protein [Streptomyces scopuliridis]
MELRRLEYYLVLARVLHFGRAAEELHISQPGLSQQIKVLEQELGTSLIHRGTKSITLTTAGEVLREQGERVLAEVRLCVEQVRAVAEQPTGVLRVAYTRSGADLGMYEFVEGFRARYPTVRLPLSTAWTGRNLELLEADEADVAFVRSMVRHRAVESLVVATEELVVAMPDDHPLAARERVSFDDVIDQPLVHWPGAQGPGYYDEIRRQIWGDRHQRVVLEQPDAEPLLREVAHRVGIAVLDEHRARKLCPPGVRVRHISGWSFPVAWITTVSPLALVVIIPLVARVWKTLGERQPGPVTKVAMGLTQIGCSYLFLLIISEATGDADIPLILILLFMMAAGSSEVFVGPVGLSLATRIGPGKFRSQMVGLNFLTLALGSSLAGLLGQLFTAIDNASYFTLTAVCGIGVGLDSS